VVRTSQRAFRALPEVVMICDLEGLRLRSGTSLTTYYVLLLRDLFCTFVSREKQPSSRFPMWDSWGKPRRSRPCGYPGVAPSQLLPFRRSRTRSPCVVIPSFPGCRFAGRWREGPFVQRLVLRQGFKQEGKHCHWAR
jgi:hypothetical protein